MTTLADNRTETNYLFLVNNLQGLHEPYNLRPVFIFANLEAVSDERNTYVHSSSAFDPKIFYAEQGEDLADKLTEIFSTAPVEGFSQKDTAFEAAAIFRSFGIKNILVQFTGDESVMFEFVQANIYFLLEIFGDGDIAYLRRRGKEEPLAYDISRNDLYRTIEAAYNATLESNVLQ